MTYPNSEDNYEGVATICPITPLVLGIKADTSATDMHIVDIRSVALLKVPLNTPIPNTGTVRVIPKLYLTYS